MTAERSPPFRLQRLVAHSYTGKEACGLHPLKGVCREEACLAYRRNGSLGARHRLQRVVRTRLGLVVCPLARCAAVERSLGAALAAPVTTKGCN